MLLNVWLVYHSEQIFHRMHQIMSQLVQLGLNTILLYSNLLCLLSFRTQYQNGRLSSTLLLPSTCLEPYSTRYLVEAQCSPGLSTHPTPMETKVEDEAYLSFWWISIISTQSWLRSTGNFSYRCVSALQIVRKACLTNSKWHHIFRMFFAVTVGTSTVGRWTCRHSNERIHKHLFGKMPYSKASFTSNDFKGICLFVTLRRCYAIFLKKGKSALVDKQPYFYQRICTLCVNSQVSS